MPTRKPETSRARPLQLSDLLIIVERSWLLKGLLRYRYQISIENNIAQIDESVEFPKKEQMNQS